MKNTLRIDHTKRIIIMDRTFAKLAADTYTEEYAHLQMVRNDYPTYSVVRKTIKKNKDKETWKGLTYDYMRFYIMTHEEPENRKKAVDEFEELILISKCHSSSKRYPVVKNWFLDKYPAIKEFGMPKEEKVEEVAEDREDIVVCPPLQEAA